MTRWVLSDGTIFEKGKVTGTSKIAEELRLDLDELRQGYKVEVSFGPPTVGAPLRLRSKFLVYWWLRGRTYHPEWWYKEHPDDRVTIIEPAEPPPTPKRYQIREPDDPPEGMLIVY